MGNFFANDACHQLYHEIFSKKSIDNYEANRFLIRYTLRKENLI